jgi:hypothetical protein
MVQSDILEKITEANYHSCLGIRSPENQPGDTREQDRSHAESARLQGRVEGHLRETPIPERGRRPSDRDHLRMSRRIRVEYGPIPGFGHDLLVLDEHGAHGNLAPVPGAPSLLEGSGHPCSIVMLNRVTQIVGPAYGPLH